MLSSASNCGNRVTRVNICGPPELGDKIKGAINGGKGVSCGWMELTPGDVLIL